jgi:hypothetical protein
MDHKPKSRKRSKRRKGIGQRVAARISREILVELIIWKVEQDRAFISAFP